jgi:hypothetical protein
VVNLTNILQAAIFSIFFCQKKLQSHTIIRIKTVKLLLHKKAARKMLVKLTPGVNFINVIRARFSYKFFAKAKTQQLEKAAEMTFLQKFCT